MEKLSEKKCRACEKGEKPLEAEKVTAYLNSLEGWALTKEGAVLFRTYQMKDFLDAVAFIEQIACVAETEGHHPDLQLAGYKNLRIELWTHAIDGLSENDFILAAKINEIPDEREKIVERIKAQ